MQKIISYLINNMAFYPDKYFQAPIPQNSSEVFIKAIDGTKLLGLMLENNESDKIVIYFHGNAGNIYNRIPDLNKIRNMGFNVFGLSYRGYAKSEGEPSEKGLYQDGDAAFDYIVNHLGFKLENIFIIGRSIGSTVAVNVAQYKKIKGLILITPLTNAKELSKNMGFGMLSSFIGSVFDNKAKIKNIISPLLIIHGSKDDVIPYKMGVELYNKANHPKQFVEIKNAVHNNLSDEHGAEYFKAIERFLHKGYILTTNSFKQAATGAIFA